MTQLDMVERVARKMAKVISKRHGHDDNGDSWLNDQRREEAQAAIEATGVVELREELEAASGMLIRHHQWHMQQRTPDPEYGFIPADEYADSRLYEDTANTIDKIDNALTQLAKGSDSDGS